MEPTVQDLYGVSSLCINKNWNLDDEYRMLYLLLNVWIYTLWTVESSEYVAK